MESSIGKRLEQILSETMVKVTDGKSTKPGTKFEYDCLNYLFKPNQLVLIQEKIENGFYNVQYYIDKESYFDEGIGEAVKKYCGVEK